MTWRFLWPLAASRRDAPEVVGDAPAVDARWVDVGGLGDLRDNRLVVELGGISVLVVRAGRSRRRRRERMPAPR